MSKDRRMILHATADANKELAEAVETAVTVEEKGLCAEENMLAERLIYSRRQIDKVLDELGVVGGGWTIESDEYKQGQRDALGALLSSPNVDAGTRSEIRFAAYEDRSIPKAVVDAAIEEVDDE